jgi:uncharacterized membrane protein YGL010W
MLVSIGLLILSIFVHRLWVYALALSLVGWTLQFIGHAFEHKEPEFFHDWRFLFVGVRWWWAKTHGRSRFPALAFGCNVSSAHSIR